jgi:hypothetical protein
VIILSLGAGVQSSTVLLMALAGELEPLPDAAIFADTGAEPESVYRYLDWLEKFTAVRIPIYRVSAGNLEQDVLASVAGTRSRIAQPPFHVKNNNPIDASRTDKGGMLWRGCTKDYKLVPLRRKVRELWTAAGRPHIQQWIGISLDEAHRMKDSGVSYITNVYPLVEKRITRHDCELWLLAHQYPMPPKSACYFCPYISNHRWIDVKRKDPATFQRAVAFDASLRTGKLPGVTGDAYVHRSFIPLSKVDLRSSAERGQMDLFGNECEGMCGV